MAKRNKCKARIIPPQDKRICASICLCQLIVVFSSVSLIYLTVAVYIPAYKAFHSGFDAIPVMCQTINTSLNNNCSWASCSEWCLTKASGFCPQMHVTTRHNGTSIVFEGCANLTTIACPQVSTVGLRRYNCNNGTECATLTGVFNCSLGHCKNFSEIYQCHHRADGPMLDSDKDNTKLSGFFECKGSRCVKIKRHFSCDRFCPPITTAWSNVYISMDDAVHAVTCASAMATSANRAREPSQTLSEPVEIWRQRVDQVLFISCYHIAPNASSISATDCVNGTLYNATDIPRPTMNFTQFWRIRNKWQTPLDAAGQYAPPQAALTIYNHSKLFINLDGCVNTLRGECRDFLQRDGRDGRNQTAQSRFPCFYNKNNAERVVARYDLEKTWRQLLIAATVPSVLFVISFLALCIIMQSVAVGDDTKMRCKYCLGNGGGDGDGADDSMLTTSHTYETDINIIIDALNEHSEHLNI